MPIATVSSKGQITLPVESRRALGIQSQDRVLVDITDDAIVVRKVPDFLELDGFLGRALPDEEEQERMVNGIAERVERKP